MSATGPTFWYTNIEMGSLMPKQLMEKLMDVIFFGQMPCIVNIHLYMSMHVGLSGPV